MYRGSTRSHFSISTAAQVVETRKLTNEKNQLLLIVANYLKKKADRVTTLDGLTSLEKTLTKTS
jgi:hypothetical protein